MGGIGATEFASHRTGNVGVEEPAGHRRGHSAAPVSSSLALAEIIGGFLGRILAIESCLGHAVACKRKRGATVREW